MKEAIEVSQSKFDAEREDAQRFIDANAPVVVLDETAKERKALFVVVKPELFDEMMHYYMKHV